MKTIPNWDFDDQKIEIIKKIAHPNIMKYYDSFRTHQTVFHLIIEFCEVSC